MSSLFAPLFAQLVSLQLGGRTEARYAGYSDDKRFEGSSVPAASLNVTHHRTAWTLSYAPALSLFPLERAPRQFDVFHLTSSSISYRLRHLTLRLGGSFGIGSMNLRQIGPVGQQAPNGMLDVATADKPATPGGTPPTTSAMPGAAPATGATAPPAATPGGVITAQVTDRRVRLYNWTSALTLTEQVSKEAEVGASVGNAGAAGLDKASRFYYPPLNGWFVGGNASYAYVLSKREKFVGTGTFLKTWSSNGNEAATASGAETWTHRFGPDTTSALRGGLTITRFSLASGLAGFSVFPDFSLVLAQQARAGRGGFSFSASAFSAPALDPLRALVDPRVGVSGRLGYTRDDFFCFATGLKSVSIAPPGGNTGAVNADQAEGRIGYRLGELSLVDTGARIVRQTYGGGVVIPTSWTVFVGLTVGYQALLTRQ